MLVPSGLEFTCCKTFPFTESNSNYIYPPKLHALQMHGNWLLFLSVINPAEKKQEDNKIQGESK